MDAVQRSLESRELTPQQAQIVDTFVGKYTDKWGSTSKLEIGIIKALVKSLTDSYMMSAEDIDEQMRNAGG
jgi:hypothetical protein